MGRPAMVVGFDLTYTKAQTAQLTFGYSTCCEWYEFSIAYICFCSAGFHRWRADMLPGRTIAE